MAHLEQQLQRELDLTREVARRRNLASRVAVAVVRGVALENDPIRVSEIRVIQNIERLRAELQRLALPDRDPLEQGRVDIEQARAAERTASRVPERARSRHREGTGIEPVVYCAQNHRPFKVRIQVGYVDGSSVAGAGIIEPNQRREGETALSGEDPIPLPAPDQMVHPTAGTSAKALAVPERQLIAEVGIELVFQAVGGHAF